MEMNVVRVEIINSLSKHIEVWFKLVSGKMIRGELKLKYKLYFKLNANSLKDWFGTIPAKGLLRTSRLMVTQMSTSNGRKKLHPLLDPTA